jgi:ABC-type multidrug transport system fused ATPase/permease subunit
MATAAREEGNGASSDGRAAERKEATTAAALARDATPVGHLYRHLWRFAKGARLRLLAAATLLVSSQLLKLAIPFLAGQAINAIQASGPRMLLDAGLYIGTLFAVFAGAWLLHGPGRIIERSVGVHVRTNVADALYGRTVRLPLAWHNRHHSGEIVHRVDQASRALYDFAQTQFIYLQNFVNIAGPVIALALLSATLGWAAAAGYLVVAAVIVRFDRRLMKLAAEENAAERRYSAGLLDFLGNISTVLSLRLQEPTREMLRRRLAAVFVPLRQSIVVNEFKWCAVDLLTVGLTWSLVALFAYSTYGSTGVLALGSVFMVYQYAQQAGGVIGSLATHFQNFTRIATNYASADLIWIAAEQSERPATVQHAVPQPQPGERTPTWRETGREMGREIAAVGLDFDYVRQDGTRPALRGVSLYMQRGERIALVGGSGAGKSSLLRVLAGLYQPTRGHYLVDGLAQVDLRDLSRWATLIPQEYDVFEGTVRENLTFGAAAAELAIAQALQTSGFDAVVDALPQGLETPITERGFNLSGGQRQRLALARGLLAAAGRPILLLDEPTSALDQATESLVLDRIGSAWSDGIVLASVHRMALLEKFHRVVYMADGRVVDVGTVEALRERQPLFRALLRQADAGQQAGQQARELRAG